MADGTPMTRTVPAQRSGQATTSDEFREPLGITEESLIQMTLVEGELRLRPIDGGKEQKGSLWLKDAYELFAPVRQEAIEKGYTEEEINATIDEAIAAVRAEHG